VSNNPIKFGTDGWRAIIAEDYTFDNVRVCAAATAEYVKGSGLADRGLVIGYDTRFESDAFAAAAAEVVAAAGVKVFLCDSPAPTPVIGYAILSHKAAGSIVITSSHNPGPYNGFKVRTSNGSSAAPEILAQIEALVDRVYGSDPHRMTLDDAKAKGIVETFDPKPAYLEHIGRLIDFPSLRAAGLTVLADPMFGAGMGYLHDVLSGGKTQVHEIRGEINPAFPGMHNPEPIPRNLDATGWSITTGASLTSWRRTLCSPTTCSKCEASAARW
jgi:phosphomannomutase